MAKISNCTRICADTNNVVDRIETDTTSIETKVDRVEVDTTSIETKVDRVETDTTSIETKVDTVDGYQDVPSANSTDNNQARDVIGNKTDTSILTPRISKPISISCVHGILSCP